MSMEVQVTSFLSNTGGHLPSPAPLTRSDIIASHRLRKDASLFTG